MYYNINFLLNHPSYFSKLHYNPFNSLKDLNEHTTEATSVLSCAKIHKVPSLNTDYYLHLFIFNTTKQNNFKFFFWNWDNLGLEMGS